jgi:mRNA-degrading endonuclease RelE of RelBE toxin-antitoxin system|tara:strand:- start:8186 stop:8434 length:249 start_codon:yes stop_codon:yes gene_type:complete
MLNISYKDNFLKKVKRIKDTSFKNQVKKHIKKIVENPEVGKPVKNVRKGTRELYLGSYRLPYSYLGEEKRIIILDLYHKDKQ